MAEVLAKLVVDIEGRIDKLEKNMLIAEGRAKKSTDRMGGMFKKMFAGLGLAVVVKKAFDFAVVLKKTSSILSRISIIIFAIPLF